jgi:hypothetical protein
LIVLQVVKRRVEKVGEARQGGGAPDRKRKSRPTDDDSDNEGRPTVKRESRPPREGKGKPRSGKSGDSEAGDRPNKKQRTGGKPEGAVAVSSESTGDKSKAGKSMGGLIGKKRKERKVKACK